MPKTALILGVDTQEGAYLARLLLARGYRLSGTGGTATLARLGIADDVANHDAVNAAVLAASREIYDLRSDSAATDELLAMPAEARLFIATPGTEQVPEAIERARDSGRFVAAGRVFDRESRLGNGTSFIARIIAAALAGDEPDPDDLAAATDCGWTPEYVDPMWQMLQRAQPSDFVIATGRAITGSEVARHAFAYFGHDTTRFDASHSGPVVIGDPAPARTGLGWSAVTWGRDLVRTLCEGLADEKRTAAAKPA